MKCAQSVREYYSRLKKPWDPMLVDKRTSTEPLKFMPCPLTFFFLSFGQKGPDRN